MKLLVTCFWLLVTVAQGLEAIYETTTIQQPAVCRTNGSCPRDCHSCENFLLSCSRCNLKEFPTLLPLRINRIEMQYHCISSLPPRAFLGCDNLRDIDLSWGQLRHLDSATFEGIPGLLELKLYGNSLNIFDFNSVPDNVFLGLPNLTVLELEKNNWTTGLLEYREDLFTPLRKLQRLSIDGLSNGSFKQDGISSLMKLHEFKLYRGVEYITNDTFRSFAQNKAVKVLAIHSGILKDTDALAFAHFSSLKSLNLQGNPLLGFRNLSKAWFGLQYTSIEKLDIAKTNPSFNSLAFLGEDFCNFLNRTKLKDLSLDNNGLVSIIPTLSTCIPTVEKISLSCNNFLLLERDLVNIFGLPKIRSITAITNNAKFAGDEEMDAVYESKRNSYCFSNTTNTQIIQEDPSPESPREQVEGAVTADFAKAVSLEFEGKILSEFEDIPSFDGSADGKVPPGPVFSTPSLHRGNVPATRCETSFMRPATFNVTLPPLMSEIVLSRAFIFEGEIGQIIVSGEMSLKTVDFSGNSIKKLTGPLIIDFDPDLSKPRPTYEGVIFNFADNGCEYIDPNFAAKSGSYFSSLLLKGNNLGKQLTTDKYQIFRHFSNVKILDLTDNTMTRLIHNTFLGLVKLERLFLDRNLLGLLADFKINFTLIPNLLEVSIKNNFLTNADGFISAALASGRNVSRIFIQYNYIQKMSAATADALNSRQDLVFEFRSNPFDCSCENLEFMKRLVKTHDATWKQRASCNYGNRVRSFRDWEQTIVPLLENECNSNWIVAASVSLGLLLLMLLAASFLYMQRWAIKFWFYKYRRQQPYKDTTHDQLMIYDAFISYDERDHKWVMDQLFKRLEQDEKLRLCLFKRDFIAGDFIENNIINGIHNSRKTVLLLSNHYMESEWCKFEAQVALHASLESRLDLVVVVLLEEIRPTDVPLFLRRMIKDKVYLEWPGDESDEGVQEEFWEKISRSLRSSKEYQPLCQNCGVEFQT